MENIKEVEKSIEGLLFRGVEEFPQTYHDADYYKKKMDEKNKKMKGFVDNIVPDLLDSLISNNKEE